MSNNKQLKENLMSIVFDIREKISDQEYKTLSESIAKINSENETIDLDDCIDNKWNQEKIFRKHLIVDFQES